MADKLSRTVRVITQAGRVLTGKNFAGRGLTVFPDDVFIVSYPRSGNTWTRFLIGNLIYQDEPTTFANIESRIPEIYLVPHADLRRLPHPRVLKSHEYFDHRYKRVIYIVRDPRDVAVSLYHYAIKRAQIPDSYPIDDFMPRFVRGEFFVDWSTWEDHVTSWRATRQGKPGFLFLKYEDMLANPTAELAKVADFLHLDASPDRITRAVKLSSADNMRQLEKKQSKNWKLTSKTRQDKPFVREAKAGGWKTVLTPAILRRLELAWGTTMLQVGYTPTTISTDCDQLPLANPSTA